MNLESNERQIDSNHLLRINLFEGYDFNTTAGHISYEICKYENVMWYEPDGYTYAKPVIDSGALPLTLELVSQWGSDDQPIFDYVMQELGLQWQ